ncbi:GDSL-type esterase/lipase family protein [Paenibacillus sp. FSL R10-2734]|uniref:GDSL-type esterase/lipase family protein n=1 Tax=Paenibacillus sp. FSL R10-2734 TaxID=2954691 RepID=UPI0030D8ED0A
MLNIRLSQKNTEQNELTLETPLLTLYPLETDQPRPFILVLPGGGYTLLAQHEGAPVAKWLNTLGIHAGVLDYQVGSFNVTSLLNDVEEALKWIREAPKDWNVISEQVGMIGFSAGGHLASIYTTTRPEKPNILLLGYPVITFQEPYAHKGSRLHFLGDHPTQVELHGYSSETQVTSQMPPTFIWTTANDASVPVENSLLFSTALSKQGIPFELHVFEEGRHGLGLSMDNPHCQQWLSISEKWLSKHHYVKRKELITQTLFIAGDSTAAIKGAGEKPMTGWGEYLQSYFGASVRIENRAMNGRSTKSFITDGRLDAILKDFKAGDYLFIQFGHNDEKKEDPLRYTDPDTEYRHNLLQYIEAARKLGGTPVLLTSVSRRRYTSDGQLDPLAVGAYPEAMRQVAEETQTPLLDIFTASQELYRSLGKEESKKLFMHLPEKIHSNYPNGVADDTHFCDEGAQQIARLVVQAISQSTALPISNLQPLLQGVITDVYN